VVKLKSFTQAATVLHVSQPTPTAQIKTLEDVLRLRLFGRRRRIERNRYRAERVLQDLDTVLLDVRDVALKRRGVVRIAALPRPSLPSPVSPIIARAIRDAPKRGYLDSDRTACRRYFTGMIIGYPFGVTTVINHLCMSVLLVLDAQCTYAALSGGEYAVTVKPGFMGIDGLPISCMTPVPSSTYASSCPGW
jgi:hypothetical protein